jgi:hypothetical protein
VVRILVSNLGLSVRQRPLVYVGVCGDSTSRCACTAGSASRPAYDALFWSPEFSYAETDIAALTHEQGRLREWMWTVPPPSRHEEPAAQGGARSVP